MKKRDYFYYLVLFVLLVGIFLVLVLVQTEPTGYAVFLQNNQSDFDLGVYNNTYWNGSAVVLFEDNVSGDYVSEIYGTNESVVWNDLSYGGSENLVFFVRNCSLSNCSDSSFTPVNITDLSLEGQFFQYKVVFDSNLSNESLYLLNVSLNYSFVEEDLVSIKIVEPVGSKNYTTDIPIEFNLSGGENYSCWYNVMNITNETNASLVTNGSVVLPDCNNSYFDLNGSEGDYSFTLFVNSSLGIFNKSSNFTINLTVVQDEDDEEQTTDEEEEESEDPSESEETQEIVVSNPKVSLGSIEDIVVDSGGVSKKRTLSVVNFGNVFLKCAFESYGDYSSWAIASEEINLRAGNKGEIDFGIVVPEGISSGEYTLEVGVDCGRTNASKEFKVIVAGGEENVLSREEVATGAGDELETEKSSDLAPISGLAISERVGTGGSILILFIFVSFLGLTFLTVKGYRQKKKNLFSIVVGKITALRERKKDIN